MIGWLAPEIRDVLGPAEQALVLRLVREVERGLDPRELRRRGNDGVGEIALNALGLLRTRRTDELRVRVENPDGQRSGRTAIEIVTSDSPFLVDTLRLTLRRLGMRERVLLHPVLPLERDPQGNLVRVAKERTGACAESYLYAELPVVRDPEQRAEIEEELRRVYTDVGRVVRDHGRMVKALRRHVAELECAAPMLPGGRERVQGVMQFLEWLVADHYIFLGYRYYPVARSDGQWSAWVSEESGLGILNDATRSRFHTPRSGSEIPELVRARLEEERLVYFDKSRRAATIHRSGNLDCVSVKAVDVDGRIVGFGVFVGLLTYRALRARGSEIAILRESRQRVLERVGGPCGSHNYKITAEAYDSLPVELLFQFPESEVARAVERIVAVTERDRLGVFLLPDPASHSFFVSVLVPRSRYEESLRSDLQRLLRSRYGAIYSDGRVSFLDDEVALLHFFCTAVEEIDLDALQRIEHDVEELVARWDEGLEAALLESRPEERARELVDRYGEAFPERYRLLMRGAEAVHDVDALERIRTEGVPVALSLHDEHEEDIGSLKVYQSSRPYLTDLLPKLDHLGLRVIDATLTPITVASSDPLWIVTFRIEGLAALRSAGEQRLLDALGQTIRGLVEDDLLNRLVLAARLDWREVDLLRAYLVYAHQLRSSPGKRFTAEVLADHPEATRALVALFRARFDPDLSGSREQAERAASEALQRARARLRTSSEDRVFALLSNLVTSTTRTSYFAGGAQDDPVLALKIDPARVERMPAPRPFAELLVHSASMSGVHLRGGPVARGGIRWSSRGGDFRTEILGLMKTQRVKNGLIVPVGAKGGFVLRHRLSDPRSVSETVERHYARYVRALLSLTDNRAGDRVVPPDRVVRHDGDDPYLVVAPDKGTAGLSDVANRIAEEAGFWLGDAFASGGSAGYDHKREGITARGAWVCVERHFAEIGLDPDRPFTVVGIGDMSGDVFGNGALLARRARLVAAFDHRHVFVDPDPDPERAWTERKRLFDLAGSTWRDYDPDRISDGGGVFDRDAREVPLSPRARQMLGLAQRAVRGEDLIRAILRMRVDLLWIGGIGTYVKASDETHAQVGDRANDAVRIDARELGARVVGEGGNLGLTPRARVEAARGGCRLNTDAVDNSGGVDLSDHEVNFKILFAHDCYSGRMERDARNRILARCLGGAVEHVLANSFAQALCLSLDERRSRDDPDAFLRATEFLESHAGLNPALEGLPDPQEVCSRSSSENVPSHTRPELALLLGFTKNFAKRAVLASDVPDREIFRDLLTAYFPEPLRTDFSEQICRHPLRREITATVLVNRVIDRAGVGMLPRLVDGLGVTAAEAVAAYEIAGRILDADHLRGAVLGETISEETRIVTLRRVEQWVRRGARILLALEREIPHSVAALEPWMTRCAGLREAFPRGARWGRSGVEDLVDALRSEGGAGAVVDALSRLPRLVRSLAALPLVDASARSVEEVVDAWERIGHVTRVGDLLLRLEAETRRGGWERLAVEALYLETFEILRNLTSSALVEADGGVDRFLSGRRELLERVASTIERLESADHASLAPLTLIVQQLRRLA